MSTTPEETKILAEPSLSPLLLPNDTSLYLVPVSIMQNQEDRIQALELQNRQLLERLNAKDEVLKEQQMLVVRMAEDFPDRENQDAVDQKFMKEREDFLKKIQKLERDLQFNHSNWSLALKQLLQKDNQLQKCHATISALKRENQALKGDQIFKDSMIEQLKAQLYLRSEEAKESAEKAESPSAMQPQSSDAMSEGSSLGCHAASIMKYLQLESRDEEIVDAGRTYLMSGPGAMNASSISTPVPAPTPGRQAPQ